MTEEQLKALGINLSASCFDRVLDKTSYYYIAHNGALIHTRETHLFADEQLYETANYCTDEYIMQQRAWHEILCRQLWRFSGECGEFDRPWDDQTKHHYIVLEAITENFHVFERARAL